MDLGFSSHGDNSNADVIPDFQEGPLAITHWRKGMPCYSRVATGSIFPSRFVTLDTFKEGRVLQASSSTVPLYGISQAELRGTPYRPVINQFDVYAALDGESLFIFGGDSLDVLLMYGAQVQRGDYLTSDSLGRGVKAQIGAQWIAMAQQPGNVGFVGKVTVYNGSQRRKV